MKELDARKGKIYEKDGYYYLEKIFTDIEDLIEEDPIIKKNAAEKGFEVDDYSWEVENNPYYKIETIYNDGKKAKVDPNRYILKLKLKYY